MQKYDEYKSSGIQWIGDIPSHWEVKRLKYTASIFNGNSLNDSQKKEYFNCESIDSLPYVASKDIDKDFGSVDYENGMRIPNSVTGFSVADTNTTLLCIEGGSAGKKIAYVDQPVCFVNKLCCINSKINSKYNYFFIRSNSFKEPFFRSLQGMIGGVTVGQINNFPVPIPPVEEQKAIVEYLDKKCGSIDAVIATQERRIALLSELKQSIITEAVTRGINPGAPLKDSGIEWIGKIPQHWEICRLKFCIKEPLMYGANEAPDNIDDLHPRYIRITDIDDDGQLKPNTFCTLNPQIAAAYLIEYGDILFARSGATVGKTYIHLSNEPACFAGYLIKAKANRKIALPQFLYYFSKSYSFSNWKDGINVQATIQNIGADKYANLPIPLPSVMEQTDIVQRIEAKIQPIDAAISKAKREIELLREFKQSVITEAVTGKIKVY